MLYQMAHSILLLCVTSGCAVWPDAGKGGQAEDFKVEAAFVDPLRYQNKLRLECFHKELQGISISSAARRQPAQIEKMKIMWTRATRAHAGHLNREAKFDLEELLIFLAEFHPNSAPPEKFQTVSTHSQLEEKCS